MKQLGCREMGIECNFVADGYSPDEIKHNLWAHAEQSHAQIVKSLTADKKKELTAKMDAILGVAAAPTRR